MMIGKSVMEQYEPRDFQSQETLLDVKNLSNHKLKDISFTIKKGEIVGFYGLIGAGKTELARAIFGADKYTGEIEFNSKKLGSVPSKTIQAGIAFVPEERRTQGLFTLLTIKRNIPVMNMGKISHGGIIDAGKERSVAKEYIQKLNIKTDSMEKETAKLSGGNQQKVVFSKCLFADANLLLLDEPTRGIDVGAKSEIYHIIRELAKEGKSIMFFSSELPEILNSCDRIFLLYEGEIRLELQNGVDIDAQRIIHVCTGGAC
jgi:ribose transport system ATP-binding protein